MKAVLIITSSVDVTVDYIIKRYQNEARFYRLNVDELSKYRIDVGAINQWTIACSNWKIEKSSVYIIESQFCQICLNMKRTTME